MNVYHYLKTDFADNPWEDMLITGDTQLDNFKSDTLVSINGQTIIRQHASSYITGKETCCAHHFAKMIAAAHLKGSYDHAPSLNVGSQRPGNKVLWIDSVHSIYACADFFNEMTANFDQERKRFAMICLDKLGSFRFELFTLIRYIENAIQTAKPSLIVIDDIDHLMPYCGVNSADMFNRAIRDTLNHTHAACLFIGYNHLNKRANTTGNLGKVLFSTADNIFSVTSQQAISRVRLLKSFTVESDHDNDFLFTVDKDNLPHQVVRTTTEQHAEEFLQQNTLKDIFSEVIDSGQTISPDQLYDRLINRQQRLNRIDRTRSLIAQATSLGIISKNDNNDYFLPPHPPVEPATPVESVEPVESSTPVESVESDNSVEVVQANGLYTPNPSNGATPEGCDSSTSHHDVNNSLTLPPHPQGPQHRDTASGSIYAATPVAAHPSNPAAQVMQPTSA